MSKKYFINNLDTDFGTAFLQQLVKQPTQEPVHMCSVRAPLDTKPNGIKKILKRQKPKLYAKKMIDQCEVYVYCISQTEISDIQFGIQTMNKPFQDNKVFIFVSDLLVWSDSGKKVKKQEEKKKQGEEGQGEAQGQAGQVQANKEQNKEEENKQASEQQKDEIDGDDEVAVPQEKPIQYTFFQDTDYQLRKPAQKYSYMKEIEDKILSIKKQNVKVFVICPGLIYGCGEDTLYPLYKAAWLQDQKALPYLGSGENQIPMIHLKDLVKFVIKVAQSPPQGPPYLLAFDQSSNRTQKKMIQTISKGIGSGQITQVSESALFENIDRFTIQLDIKPSKFLVGTAQEPAQFQWTAKEGIDKNIKKTGQQFCKKHNLRPIKIVMLQNDESWKKESKIDYILKIFSEYYRIPVLQIKDILKTAAEQADEELKTDLSQQWKSINEYLMQGEQKKLDQTMKVFYRAIRWRLSQNDCSNRGFILLNFPKFSEQLEYIFLKISPKKLKRKKPKVQPKVVPKEPVEGEQQKQGQQNEQQPQQQKQEQEPQQQAQQEGEGPKYQSSFPQSVISIRKAGSEAVDEVIQFFTTRGIEQLIYDTTDAKEHQIFESIRSYAERNGRPNNYLVDEEKLLQKHLKFTNEQNETSLAKRQKERLEKVKVQKQIQDARNKLRDQIAEIVRTEGEQEIKKMPFRNYLMEFVVPTLNEGLLQVSNIIPNDPVDLLSEYLYQKSYDF